MIGLDRFTRLEEALGYVIDWLAFRDEAEATKRLAKTVHLYRDAKVAEHGEEAVQAAEAVRGEAIELMTKWIRSGDLRVCDREGLSRDPVENLPLDRLPRPLPFVDAYDTRLNVFARDLAEVAERHLASVAPTPVRAVVATAKAKKTRKKPGQDRVAIVLAEICPDRKVPALQWKELLNLVNTRLEQQHGSKTNVSMATMMKVANPYFQRS